MTDRKRAFKLEKTSPVPLHDQAAAAIRRAIADGEARPGERLPPARDLAAVLVSA
jgi:GntR family transcriptional regulator